jgi:Trypsin
MTHPRSPSLVAALAALAALAACADEPPLLTTAEPEAIFNGAPVSAAARPAAVFLSLAVPQGAVACTGTLIAPDLVLTAAHCTRCASSVIARVLGEHPAAPTGTVGALPFYPAAAGGVSTHPDAFAGQSIDCDQPVDELQDEMSDKIDPGADLGLVRLAAPSAIAPARVLLLPPAGFSPVQDLFGAQVAIVGRGRPSDGSTQVSVMRQGFHDLSSFRASGNSCAAPSTRRFTLNASRSSSEAIIMSGDSGGPMFASVAGVGERVIGVASASALSLLSFHAPTFTFANSRFISQALGPFTFTDHDGDDVIDYLDNCPMDANTDQLDRDGDSRGDVCDNCTPRDPTHGGLLDLTRFTGPPAGAAALANWGQENANAEAEDRQILAALPGLLTAAGEVRRISNDDYRRALGDDAVCRTGALGTIASQRRGDACDVIPAATATATYRTLPGEDFVGGTELPCAANGYALGTCTYEVMNGFALEGVRASGASTGKVGLRHCRCDAPRGTAAERRLHCASGPAQCAIDPALYQLDHPRWKKLDLDGADASGEALTSLAFPGGAAAVGWDALADLVGLTGGALPPKPWAIDAEGDLVGGPALHGVLWSHVVSLGGVATTSLPDDEGRRVAALASTYGDGDLRFARRVHWKRIPRYKPAFWWQYCAMCGGLPAQSWLDIVSNPAGEPTWAIAVGPHGGTDVSRAVDRTARALLARPDAFHVNASEPEALLQSRGVTSRAVVVQTGAVAVIGALAVSGGVLTGAAIQGALARRLGSAREEEKEAKEDASPVALADAPLVYAYAATTGTLHALHHQSGRTLLRRFALRAAQWSTTPITGVALGLPLAALYSPDDGCLYVLDRGDGAAVRLMRVDLRDGRASVVFARVLEGAYAAVGLSLIARGRGELAGEVPVSVLLSASPAGTRVTRLARLQLPLGRAPLWQRDTASHGEALAGAAHQGGSDARFLVDLGDGFEVRSLPPAAFTRVEAAVEKPVF